MRSAVGAVSCFPLSRHHILAMLRLLLLAAVVAYVSAGCCNDVSVNVRGDDLIKDNNGYHQGVYVDVDGVCSFLGVSIGH